MLQLNAPNNDCLRCKLQHNKGKRRPAYKDIPTWRKPHSRTRYSEKQYNRGMRIYNRKRASWTRALVWEQSITIRKLIKMRS